VQNAEEFNRKITFRRGYSINNPNRLNWVVPIDGKIWEQLMAKGMLYMNWRAHNIKKH